MNVDTSVIFPNAHSVEALYGSFNKQDGIWSKGKNFSLAFNDFTFKI